MQNFQIELIGPPIVVSGAFIAHFCARPVHYWALACCVAIVIGHSYLSNRNRVDV